MLVSNRAEQITTSATVTTSRPVSLNLIFVTIKESMNACSFVSTLWDVHVLMYV